MEPNRKILATLFIVEFHAKYRGGGVVGPAYRGKNINIYLILI